jgi:hypothetical protein
MWGLSMPDDAHSDRAEAGEVIVKVGAEGGSWTLVGIKAVNGWRFRAIRNEAALYDLLSEEDREGLEFRHESDWVETWESALSLFDTYPWHLLRPLHVHPDFRLRTWTAVQDRCRKDSRAEMGDLDCWGRLCHGKED